ncbi:RNA-binding protein 7 [Nasonia vitripennis]|uniref:RRM domain-containing protein n=1 Tax=Nasonia vitripennis TaxID=7425 RepID=A0A7M7LJY8_NASVI|nr:RNA-binding protein 7 [Nasonia vitripennis]
MADEDARTIWCGNLSEQITEDILYELFLQAGPIQKVSIPKERDGKPKSFGFVTYKNLCSVPYALELFDGTVLFNRSLNLKSRNNTVMMKPELFGHERTMPHSNYNSGQYNFQNELQLGHQVLLGNKMGFAQSNMFNMIPISYPSQNSFYSQNSQKMDYPRNGRHHGHRNHPYNDRDNYSNRNNHRQESHNKREHKSYKSSSHRSDRHESRRKYR